MKRVEGWQKSGALDPDKLKGTAEGLVKAAEVGMRGIAGVKGATWGAQLGTAIGGPVGTAVGAAIGGAIGYFSPEIVKGILNFQTDPIKQQAFNKARGGGGYARAAYEEEKLRREAMQKEYDRRSAEALQKVTLDINALKVGLGMGQQNVALTQQDRTAQLTSAISQLVSKQQNSNPLQPLDTTAITNALNVGLSPLNNLPGLLNNNLSTMQQSPIPQPVSIEQVINHQANAQIAAQLSNITINDTAKIESIAKQVAQHVSQSTYNTMMTNLQAQIQASR